MDRRRFLQLSAASLAGGTAALSWRALAASQSAKTRLAMPPLLDTRQTGRLSLTAQPGQTSILGGAPAATAGFNQGYLGPTIVMRNGPLDTTVANQLREPVTAHWHGMLVPGHHDGGGHTPIRAGAPWKADMQIAQNPCTAWYHSHIHGRTAPQVYAGLAGVIHVVDGRDDQRGLPSNYGVDDLTIIIQDRRFDDAGRMVYNPSMVDILNGFKGERILLNGQARTVVAVPKGVARLRFLNGSNARIYTLHFDDDRPMHLIATDGGYLTAPVALQHVRVAPGERMEVLVDFSEAKAGPIYLESIRGLPILVAEFAVDEMLPARITSVRASLDGEPAVPPPEDITVREFALSMTGASGMLASLEQPASPPSGDPDSHAGHGAQGAHDSHGGHDGHGGSEGGEIVSDFAINGRSFDVRRIDLELKQGTYERWIVSGGGGIEHPFHVHGLHFRVDRQGGAPAPPEYQGWKDTMLLVGSTELIVRFDHPAGRDTPFMYHCHILEHEDAGMMGQFSVS